MMTKKEIQEKYSFIVPCGNFIAVKRIKDENVFGIKGTNSEDNAYAQVISVSPVLSNYYGDLEIGSLVVINEYEGQELFKYGKVQEDDILIIEDKYILALIK